MVQIATDIMTSQFTGRPSPVPALREKKFAHYGVKEAVFPFNMFPEVDPLLGPEMRSTGEVLGISADFGEAYFKAQEATQVKLPLEGTVLISINDKDKDELVEVAKGFNDCGMKIVATRGTGKVIADAGIPVEIADKIHEGRPNVLDLITNGKIDIIVNSPIGKQSKIDDSYILKAAIKSKTRISPQWPRRRQLLRYPRYKVCEEGPCNVTAELPSADHG
jgi:carbamoyl-phosphate synthase large subunit